MSMISTLECNNVLFCAAETTVSRTKPTLCDKKGASTTSTMFLCGKIIFDFHQGDTSCNFFSSTHPNLLPPFL